MATMGAFLLTVKLKDDSTNAFVKSAAFKVRVKVCENLCCDY